MAQPDVISLLTAEGAETDRLLSTLDGAQWTLLTPAPGWTIAHQVAHLAATFRMAGLAAADPAAFGALAGTLGPDFDANVHAALTPFLALPPDRLRAACLGALNTACAALAAVPAGQVVPWLVRPLPPQILAAAGLMELFGHGQDIVDALGTSRPRTDRIAPLVAFAVRTWDFGYQARGLATPDTGLRFELTAPSGALWAFGPQDAGQRITGDAYDFCLLVTRRRHRDDLALTATGDIADGWLDIAQAYRGPAGKGRAAGQFRGRAAA